VALNARIILKPAFSVVGLSCPMARLNGDFEALWQQLGDRYSEIPQADPDTGYGVHTWDASGHVYLAGLSLGGGARGIPEDMTVLKFEAHSYAVFTHSGLLQALPETVVRIFEGWLPDSGYEIADDYYFEYYDDRFTPGSPDSVIFLWVPVAPKV